MKNVMKRTMLAIGLTLVIAAANGVSGMAQGHVGQSSGEGSKDVVGAWLVKGNTAIQGQFNVLMTFHSDGTMSADEPSAYETAGHGTWTKRGPSQYAYTFLAFIGSASGAYSGWIKVVGTVDLGRHGWDGPFRVDVKDPGGNTLFTDSGTFNGRPITVERLN